MAAPMDKLNLRELIPPPTNFLNTESEIRNVDHFEDLRSVLESIHAGRNHHGSLLKGEQITLSRLLYKNKNSQRRWKLYQLLVKLEKCVERLSESPVHSYAATMLSAWDSSFQTTRCDNTAPTIMCPSRQMLEYLCVVLQGCAKLCVHIVALCEQTAIIMLQILHKGLFISINLLIISIVSRIRVLICNFFKSAMQWYDKLIPWRFRLTSTSAEWLDDGGELPESFNDWLGPEAELLTISPKSSKTSSELSILEKLFSHEMNMVSGSDERTVAAITADTSQLHTSLLAVKTDLGEKLSRSGLAALIAKRQGYQPFVTTESPQNLDSTKTNVMTLYPPSKRRKITEDVENLQDASKKSSSYRTGFSKKRILRGRDLLKNRRNELNWQLNAGQNQMYSLVKSNTNSAKMKESNRWVGQKAKGVISTVLKSVSGKSGKVGKRRRPSLVGERRASSKMLRRSLSRESIASSNSDAGQRTGKSVRLQQHIRRMHWKRKSKTNKNKKKNKKRKGKTLKTKNSCVPVSTISGLNSLVIEFSSVSGHQQLPKQSALGSSQISEYKLRASTLPSADNPPSDSIQENAPKSHSPYCTSGLSVTVPKVRVCKKERIVKRLQKMKRKVLGKGKVKGGLQNIPGSSLHFANQMVYQQPSIRQLQQVAKPPPPPPHELLKQPMYNFAEQQQQLMGKSQGKKGANRHHHTQNLKQNPFGNQAQGEKKVKSNADLDMDSIFSSLL